MNPAAPALAVALALGLSFPAASRPVRDACPGLEAALQDALAGTVFEVGEAARIQVSWVPRAGRAPAVALEGGPAAYRRVLARALRRADCPAADGHPLAFTVEFVDPWGRGPAL